jgi:hypothetical protein
LIEILKVILCSCKVTATITELERLIPSAFVACKYGLYGRSV